MESDRRQFKRIKYPDEHKPKIVVRTEEGEEIEYAVIDISEKGISLIGEEASGIMAELKIEATITFSDGESLDVKGEVLRVIGSYVVIYLPEGIPPSRIQKEHELSGN